MLKEAFILVTFDNYSHHAQEFAREKKMSKRRKNLLKTSHTCIHQKILVSILNSAIFERTDQVKSAKK